MARTSVDQQTSVIVRLAGPHETLVEIHGETVKVMMPTTVITIADHRAAWSIWKAWRDARQAVGKIFPTTDRAPGYAPQHTARTFTSIAFTGAIKGRDVQGKIPAYSPSGCGELKVRVGSLVIVCDDGYAARAQIDLWGQAYDLACELWPGRLAER